MQINSQGIYNKLRKQLIVEGMKERTKLKPEVLRETYGCAASTIREVLFRLSCDGFVEFEDQKGFWTPSLSDQNLEEIISFRIMLEQRGSRLSIEKNDLEWEAKLIAAHHKLAHIEARMHKEQNISDYISLWSDAEWDFHKGLVALCGNQLLMEAHHTTYDRHRQHLIMRNPNFGFRSAGIEEHQAILDAALARDVKRCAEEINIHLKNSMLPKDKGLAS